MRKPQFSEQLPERFSDVMGTHMKDFHLPLHSRSVVSRIGVVPARKKSSPRENKAIHGNKKTWLNKKRKQIKAALRSNSKLDRELTLDSAYKIKKQNSTFSRKTKNCLKRIFIMQKKTWTGINFKSELGIDN